jgi:hypothetical protein
MRFMLLTLVVLPRIAPAMALSNPANDYLLSISSAQQADALGKIVGDSCVGGTAFYMGAGEKGIGKDKAFWSLRCVDGREFEIMVNPEGSSKVLECSYLRLMNAGECFKKLPLD